MDTSKLLGKANSLRPSYEATLGTPEKARSLGLKPVFGVGVKGTVREEQYIERMIARDRKLNWG